MLKLKNIKKDYTVADYKVHALKGVSIEFRESEFVSILGPSGCGKTTMLNIIGGLDHYTSGDLIIDETSTKKYTDRDWDTYRNHKIGFIFQSYNLIPHQTVLENVELALNISGVDKSERIKRAKTALDKVGLKGEYYKKPNQLSGGQCQRVAIARALVGDPDILLADEPTGALDSTTSIQIMGLIKEISKDRLVIMVTHNKELAEEYSTRIVNLLDGEIISDSAPYEKTDEKKAKSKKTITKKSKLSLFSAFKLSFRNLKSKFKRTLLVCFAGSIGITGVASVLAVSTGIQNYIDRMQEDMLSGNPITIAESTIDLNKLSTMQGGKVGKDEIELSIENGKVNVNFLVDYLIKSSEDISSLQVENKITEEYIDYVYNMPKDYYASITTEYGINVANNLFTTYNFEADSNTNTSISVAKQMYSTLLEKTEYANLSPLISTLGDTFMQIPDSEDYIMSQYEFITSTEKSKFPTKTNEILIVVNDENEINDLLLAQLGYYSQEEFFNIVYRASYEEGENNEYDSNLNKEKFSYDELLDKTFTWYSNDLLYKKVEIANPIMPVAFEYNHLAQEEWSGVELEITGIVKPKDGLSYGSLQSGFYYTSEFTKMVLNDSAKSEIVTYLTDKQIEQLTNSVYYNFNYKFKGDTEVQTSKAYIGSLPDGLLFSSMMGGMSGSGGQGSSQIPSQSLNYYILTLRELGGVDMPNNIKIYPTNFDYKDSVTKYLDEWNGEQDIIINGETYTAEDREHIVYTDALTLVIGLINTLIDIVTTALICFTSLSLVVSTVMIAIITYVSVIERVKEIGVIRALGGRKKDVSRLFNAETFIIGAFSGLIGVGITYLLSAIINVVVRKLASTNTIAILTVPTALIMISISIVLTLISGLVPARLAAKKDPVVALRSE